MKCKFCGAEKFIGHQVCRMDVLVDGTGMFLDSVSGDTASDIYDSETPYGPFLCAVCGAEYGELEEGQEPISGPNADWQNQTGPFAMTLAPYQLDGTDIQHWENSHYKITIGRTSPQLISILISKKKDASEYLPELAVTREMSQIMPESIKIIPAACELDQDSVSIYLQQIRYAERTANDILEFFISPIREGSFNWNPTTSA